MAVVRAQRASAVPSYIFGAFGGLLFGYDLGVVAGALLYIKPEFHLDSVEVGFVTSSLLLGAMIGALGCGGLSERYGRRRVVLAAGVLFSAGAPVASLAPVLWVLLAGRLVMGLAIGALSVSVPVYLSEIAPPASRGALSGLNQLMISTGILVAYLVDLGLGSSHAWRWMFGLALVPAVALMTGLIFQPESPRWLVRQGRIDEARAVLTRNRTEAEADADIAEIRGAASQGDRRAELGEMFPLRVRAMAMGIATFANWLGNLLVGQFFPQLLGAGTGTVFFIFAGIAIGACLFAIRWIPETRNRTLEQIEGDLALSTGREREEVGAHGM
jgi:MFS family permease